MTFNTFNWPKTIKKVTVTVGYTNQATGEWIPEVTVDTVISAHVSDVNQKELQYIAPGLVAQGVRKLACDRSVGLAAGDRVKITEMNGIETEWIIHAKQFSTGLLQKHAGIDRETPLLKRRT